MSRGWVTCGWMVGWLVGSFTYSFIHFIYFPFHIFGYAYSYCIKEIYWTTKMFIIQNDLFVNVKLYYNSVEIKIIMQIYGQRETF